MPDQDLSQLLIPGPGKILVRVKPVDEVNKSGLWLSEGTVKELQGGARPTQGTVVAVGDEDDSEPVSFVEVGDRVIFGRYNGVELSYGRGERVILLRHTEILAKYRDPETSADVKVKE